MADGGRWITVGFTAEIAEQDFWRNLTDANIKS